MEVDFASIFEWYLSGTSTGVKSYHLSEVVSRLRARRFSHGFVDIVSGFEVDFVSLCAVFC